MKRPRGASRLVGGPSSPISASPLSRIADQEVAHAAGVAILRIERRRSSHQIPQFGSECLELGDALLDRFTPPGQEHRQSSLGLDLPLDWNVYPCLADSPPAIREDERWLLPLWKAA